MADLELPNPLVRLSFAAEIANAILIICAASLDDTTRGRPGLLLTGHATPPDDCCDFLSVVFNGFRASAPGTTASPRQYAERCADVNYAAEVAITVARGHAPTVNRARRQASAPTQQQEQELANALSEDAVALMYRATPAIPLQLKQLVAFPWLGPVGYTPTRLTPFSDGGCAGWMAQGTLALPTPPPQLTVP